MNLQAGLLRLVSTTEAFVDALLVDSLKRSAGTRPTVQGLITQAEVSGSRSWSARQEVYRRTLGIQLSKRARWRDVEAATHARNTIAHGLGRLTASQRSNVQLPKTLSRIAVALTDGRIRVTVDSIENTFGACEAFIRDLDRNV